LGGDLAGGDLKGRKEARGAVARVVVGMAFDLARLLIGSIGARSIKGLDLGLLVDIRGARLTAIGTENHG
jgi:hypothetical protein